MGFIHSDHLNLIMSKFDSGFLELILYLGTFRKHCRFRIILRNFVQKNFERSPKNILPKQLSLLLAKTLLLLCFYWYINSLWSALYQAVLCACLLVLPTGHKHINWGTKTNCHTHRSNLTPLMRGASLSIRVRRLPTVFLLKSYHAIGWDSTLWKACRRMRITSFSAAISMLIVYINQTFCWQTTAFFFYFTRDLFFFEDASATRV